MNFADLIPRLITIASDVGKEIMKVYEGNHKFLQLKKDQSLLTAKRSKSIDGCRPYIASLPRASVLGEGLGTYRVQGRAFGTDFYASCP
ncbi:hypothetical protein BDD26_2820 [Xenorhabdus cabanillasii]|uniref:Uncharacterized protein n=1 Tax=Xenorhabdus cabanillasii TaxID=351673 RepID=A0A3D9UHV4_9GAMM|nr:hypothetical protein BDD26_2820 [Xenorhabdus cabanillasii]